MPPRDPERPRAVPAPAAAVGRARSKGRAPQAVVPATPRAGATRGQGSTPEKRVASAPQRGERGRPGRWRVLWGTGRLAALVLAIACAGGLVYLLTANLLTVRSLTIVGAGATEQGQIAETIGVMGNNIFTVEPQAAAERLAALPTVREATVWPELPDRLVIRLTERQPLLVWQVGSDRFLVDERGLVMAVNPPAERTGNLPIVNVRDTDPPSVGGRIDAALAVKLTVLLHRAPEYGLPVAAVDYSPQSGIVLFVDKDRRILFGDGARLEDQLAVSAAIAGTDNGWMTLNVTDPDRPFFPAR